ncbi:MAG TPA: LemA family protein [Gemmatimonadaceae bacterium]|nr:LemA family protein [Gemmatimonadaceae bacterium]
MRRSGLAVVLMLALAPVSGCGYNTIQTYEEQVDAAKAQIEVTLKRRADLVPNLVETVKGFAKQESEVLTNVTRARAGLVSALERPGGTDAAELAQADAQLTRAINVVVEAYPELRSNENFLRLQDELVGTENRIATARTDYNQAVQRYNSYIRRFPQNLTAKMTGAEPRTYFEVTNEADREAPTVKF